MYHGYQTSCFSDQLYHGNAPKNIKKSIKHLVQGITLSQCSFSQCDFRVMCRYIKQLHLIHLHQILLKSKKKNTLILRTNVLIWGNRTFKYTSILVKIVMQRNAHTLNLIIRIEHIAHSVNKKCLVVFNSYWVYKLMERTENMQRKDCQERFIAICQ